MPATRIRLIAFAALATLACNTVSEPGADTGALEVALIVTGTPASSASYTVIVTTAGESELQRRVLSSSGGTVLISELPSGHQWVRLSSPPSCWTTGLNPFGVTIQKGQTSRIVLIVSCAGPTDNVYYRSSPLATGVFSERYVFGSDGAFRLQFRGTFGFYEFLGTYWHEDTLYHLSFNATAGYDEWTATGTLHGECLAVAYNLDMMLSDFADGTYCSVPSTQDAGAWESLRPMPQARWQAGATSLNGIVYVGGGVVGKGSGWMAPTEILAYDPTQDTWRTAGKLLSTVRAPALAAVGDRIYVIGGCRDNPWEPIADLQIFDPATGSVEAGPPMSHGRCGLAVTVQDGRIHAVGGTYKWAPDDILGEWDTTHEVFDPATGSWSTLAPLPRPRGGHGAVTMSGKIYVAGGMGDTLQVYDPITDSWTLSRSPRGRFGVAAAAFGNVAYFFGGSEYQDACCSGPVPSATVDRYGLLSGNWEQVAPMPTPRTGHAAAVVDGIVYVVGGSSTGGASGALAVLERYTP